MNKKIIALPVIVLMACACTNNVNNLALYKPVEMAKSSILPSEQQLLGKKSKVIIFEVSDANIALAKDSDVGVTISNAVEKQLSVSNVEFVDSRDNHNILAAITSNSTIPDENRNMSNANYAITGEVGAANFSTKYAKAYTYENDDGKITYYPAKCTYSATVTANIRIHQLPSIKMLRSNDVAGSNSSATEDSGRSMKTCPEISGLEIQSLVRNAGAKAVSNSSVALQNFFAAKGYVLERRIKDDENIFKISLGSEQGAKQYLHANIYSLSSTSNAITGKSEIEENKITEGKITNQIGQRFAWISVEDEELASQIKTGDVVKIDYNKDMLDRLLYR